MQMSRNVKLINIVLLKSSTNQANLQANTKQRFRSAHAPNACCSKWLLRVQSGQDANKSINVNSEIDHKDR